MGSYNTGLVTNEMVQAFVLYCCTVVYFEVYVVIVVVVVVVVVVVDTLQ